MQRSFVVVVCAISVGACKAAPSATLSAASESAAASAAPPPLPTPSASAAEEPVPAEPDPKRYGWLADDSAGAPQAVDTLRSRFPTPPSYRRVKVEPGSFGEWLRDLPLAAAKTGVSNVKGAVVHAGDDQYLAAVVAIDYGKDRPATEPRRRHPTARGVAVVAGRKGHQLPIRDGARNASVALGPRRTPPHPGRQRDLAGQGATR